MSRSIVLILAALIGCTNATTTALAESGPVSLQASPTDVALTLPAGVSRVGGAAIAYRPREVAPGRLSLVVLLHGAGGDPRSFLDGFRRLADRNGYVLLAPQSAERTWELQPPRKGKAVASADAASLDSALTQLFALAPIDPQHIAVIGFSDGASYALTIGLSNPQLFRGIVALSGGFAWRPERIDPTQRIFIAHGRQDRVLPFTNVRDQMVPGLQQSGLDPRVHWFNGGHVIDPDTLDPAIAYALGQDGGLSDKSRTR